MNEHGNGKEKIRKVAISIVMRIDTGVYIYITRLMDRDSSGEILVHAS